MRDPDWKNKVGTATYILSSHQPDLHWVCLRMGPSTVKHRWRRDLGPLPFTAEISAPGSVRMAVSNRGLPGDSIRFSLDELGYKSKGQDSGKGPGRDEDGMRRRREKGWD